MTKITPNSGSGKIQNELLRETRESKREHKKLAEEHRRHVDEHNKHVDMEEKENRKTSLVAWISLVIGSLSFAIGLLSLWGLNTVGKTIYVSVGMTPFHVNDRSDLIGRYQSYLRPINEKLNYSRLFTQRDITLEIALADDYRDILSRLCRENDIRMAFVSQFLYDELRYDNTRRDEVKLIGFKTMNDSNYYESVIIWNKNVFKTLGADKKKALIEALGNPTRKLYLGPRESVSTHIIPEMFLMENNVDTTHYSTSREEMIEAVKNNRPGSDTIVFGALSNEDYERMDVLDRKRIDSCTIRTGIPYDALLVNKKWWCDNLENRHRKRILKAMKYDKNEGYTMGVVSYLDPKFKSIDSAVNNFGTFLRRGNPHKPAASE